jgi:hypothetical protein
VHLGFIFRCRHFQRILIKLGGCRWDVCSFVGSLDWSKKRAAFVYLDSHRSNPFVPPPAASVLFLRSKRFGAALFLSESAIDNLNPHLDRHSIPMPLQYSRCEDACS